MENKQTAVDWLVQKYFNDYNILIPELEYGIAKQMEKEQIMDAYARGRINAHSDSFDEDWGREFNPMSPEEYYNEQHGNKS